MKPVKNDGGDQDLTFYGTYNRVKNEIDNGSKENWHLLGLKNGGSEAISTPSYIDNGFIFGLRTTYPEPQQYGPLYYSMSDKYFVINCVNHIATGVRLSLYSEDGAIVRDVEINTQVAYTRNYNLKMADKMFCK